MLVSGEPVKGITYFSERHPEDSVCDHGHERAEVATG